MLMLRLLITSLVVILIFFCPAKFGLILAVLILYLMIYPQIRNKILLISHPSSDIQTILNNCKSLHSTYNPPVFLFNGFAQGIFGMSLGSIPGQSIFCDEVSYTPTYLNLKDGGRISIDWILPTAFSRILIISPGLGSSSQSQSVRTVALEAKNKNFAVAVVHGRGIMCELKVSSTQTAEIFNLCSWRDYDEAIRHIHDLYPHCVLAGLGMSMGGTVLTKYACKTGSKSLLKALVIVSSPIDCLKNSEDLKSLSNYFGFFDFLILTVLKKIISRIEPEFKKFHESFESKGIDLIKLKNSRTCSEFDDLFTCRMLGLRDSTEYYEKASCGHLLKNVKIPMLAINSKDDTVVSHRSVPTEEFRINRKIALALLSSGGHVGFFRGHLPPKRWFQVPCVEFLVHALDESNKLAGC